MRHYQVQPRLMDAVLLKAFLLLPHLSWAAQAACVFNGTMPRWTRLNVGDAICNGMVALTLHENGLVLTQDSTTSQQPVTLWRMGWDIKLGLSGVASYGSVSNGEFCVYEVYDQAQGDIALWCTGTTGSRATEVSVRKRGSWDLHGGRRHVVYRAPGAPVKTPVQDEDRRAWRQLVSAATQKGNALFSGTVTTSHPNATSELYPDSLLKAGDGAAVLSFQMDGNIVLHGSDAKVLWDAGCYSSTPRYLQLQRNGVLVTHDGNTTYWQSHKSKATYARYTYLLMLTNRYMQIVRSPGLTDGMVVVWRKP